jgi:hypothetical protein
MKSRLSMKPSALPTPDSPLLNGVRFHFGNRAVASIGIHERHDQHDHTMQDAFGRRRSIGRKMIGRRQKPFHLGGLISPRRARTQHRQLPGNQPGRIPESRQSRQTGTLNIARTCGYHDHNRDMHLSL